MRLHEPDDPAAVERQVREGAAELGCTELPVAEDLVTVPLAEQGTWRWCRPIVARRSDGRRA
ncbi:MAG: hypothetical protein R2699_12145 [Acidimicrobiales bacterium]